MLFILLLLIKYEDMFSVLPTLLDEISPRDWFFYRQNRQPSKMPNFQLLYLQKSPKIADFPEKSLNFAKITHFFFGDFSKSNFVGDFCKKVVANQKPKIADLAKNRQSWQHWSCLLPTELRKAIKNKNNARHALFHYPWFHILVHRWRCKQIEIFWNFFDI